MIENQEFQDFDWAELERRLGEAKDELGPTETSAMAGALRSLIEWAVSGQLRGEIGINRIARRTIALAWVLELFPEHVSLSDLARNLGVHKMMMSNQASEFSKTFGVRNHQQKLFNR